MDPSTHLLANVVAFINRGQEPGATSPTLPRQVLQSVSSVAARILATASPNFATFSPMMPHVLEKLKAWAAGRFEPNEVVRPQLITAMLLFAETWKRGS